MALLVSSSSNAGNGSGVPLNLKGFHFEEAAEVSVPLKKLNIFHLSFLSFNFRASFPLL